MNNKKSIIFIILFLVLPITFMLSSFGWRYLFLHRELIKVATDCLSILGIYYVIVSFIFSFGLKNINLKDL
ncbi:hypothetical protein CEQ21_04580 [Niallia circulans]|uniref:NADH dehydrogenase subunit 4 n=1 Tax=Niallia circulans TaxID=1397 RepID=A0A553STE0_NIACI|nr:hypothetical protein [Niallia circulans]TRZ40221.1 hypothetical protein CEQ21_04580 [Niallia circulans]